MNKAWHEKHKMPRGVNDQERLAWHLEHQKHCKCRPIPAGLRPRLKTGRINLYVGTSGFKYKKWKGPFYPENLSEDRMLHYYGGQFKAVEINYTFRTMPTTALLQKWAGDVSADFRFVLKARQRITHIKRLKDVGEELASFLKVARALRERLGPLLFQLPPNMKKDAPRLRAFLKLLRSRCRAAFEFRHASWFDEEVFGMLRDHQAALCIAEAENDLEVPFVATADWGYLRLRRPDYSTAELKTWVKRVCARDWQSAFVFFKHEDEGKGPQMAKKFLELWGRLRPDTGHAKKRA